MEACKICNSKSQKIFSRQILKKYEADYYKCSSCGFVQTSEPVWIEEAYSSAITFLDIGLLNRNLHLQEAVPRILDACFPKAKVMLDYAGGYGTFTRLMRDKGFDFYRQDPYCENLFAKYFDISDTAYTAFDVLTAFEVFEHFVDPVPEIDKLFRYSENIIFSTELLPGSEKELEDWWYLSTETGQHVAFYSPASLEYLANKYGKHYYRKGTNLHAFTSQALSADQVNYAFRDASYKSEFFGLIKTPYSFKTDRPSLLERDYQYIKQKHK